MIGAYLRRGIVAGLLAGVVAGLVGLVAAEPALDDAVALEAVAAVEADAHDEPAVTRAQQKAGLVVGYTLVGAAVGALFSLASAWAVGRVAGDGWSRSVKLGAVAAGAMVVLPFLKYPPNPPGVGDPDTVGARTALYLALALMGLLLAAAAWTATRQFRVARRRGLRQAIVATAVVVVGVAMLAVLPTFDSAAEGFPAELLWRFRLSAGATQLSLWTGVAVAFGLLTERAERGPEASQ